MPVGRGRDTPQESSTRQMRERVDTRTGGQLRVRNIIRGGLWSANFGCYQSWGRRINAANGGLDNE